MPSPPCNAPSQPIDNLRAEVGALAKHDPWFGPKRVGAGWGPRTWQGWLIVALFTAVVVGITIFWTIQNN